MNPGPPIVEGFLVRLMQAADVAAVQAIAARVPTAPHWPDAEFERMAQVVAARPDQRGAWIALHGAGSAEILVAGFAFAHRLAHEAEVESIVTAPEFRRQGVGGMLLTQIAAWSRALGADRLLLESRSSNENALRLYRAHGFQVDGVRPRYYRNPEEDAVLMSLKLRDEGSSY